MEDAAGDAGLFESVGGAVKGKALADGTEVEGDAGDSEADGARVVVEVHEAKA